MTPKKTSTLGLNLALMLVTLNAVIGQNLINNPSFEDTLECPYQPNMVSTAKGWTSINTSDLYHECSSKWQNSMISVPKSWYGFQYAANGKAYCGAALFYQLYGTKNLREFICTDLKAPLLVGRKYYVSFKLNLAINDAYGKSNCAIDKVGAFFSTNTFDNTNLPQLKNTSHFTSNTFIADSASWTRVLGSFVADSAYDFVSFGNFFDDDHTNTLVVDSSSSVYPLKASYYFFDEMCVSLDSAYCRNFVTALHEQVLSQKLRIFPNPSSGLVTIVWQEYIDEFDLSVTDLVGKQIISLEQLRDSKISLDLQSYQGLFLIQVKTKQGCTQFKVAVE